MAVMARVNGLVRRTDVLRKRDDGTVFGSTLAVLSEPEGDSIEVLSWANGEYSATDLAMLKGAEVELLVEFRVKPGFRGSEGTLQAILHKVISAEQPATVPA